MAVARLADGERTAAPDRAAGCELRKAPFGYPDWYLSRQLVPTVHPPVVAAGWRRPEEPVEFDVLLSPCTSAGGATSSAARARRR